MNSYTIAFGNPWDGVELLGKFDTPQEANDYASVNGRLHGDEWHVVKIQQVADVPLWENNLVQFARLISEIQGAWSISENDWQALRDSMDLENDDLMALFDRAFDVWDAAKARVSGIPEGES
jgi:hypothetical protein